MIRLTTPLGEEVLDLHAGDRVLLSGIIYTARDEAHMKIREDGFPFDPKGAVIYHCGPVIDEAQNKVVAAGPTTSARMNDLTKPMLDAGVRGLIGKGGMSAKVRDELRGRAGLILYCMQYAVLPPHRAEGSSRPGGSPVPRRMQDGCRGGPWYICLDEIRINVFD